MHTRRIAAFLLGAWLAGSIMIPLLVMYNFRSVTRLIESPGAERAGYIIQGIGKQDSRALLRFWIADLNTNYFYAWELAQLALGIALIAVLIFASTRKRFAVFLASLMLILVAFTHFYVSPEIAYQGQGIDFLQPDQAQPRQQRIDRLHGITRVVEITKIALGVILAGYLFTMRAQRRRFTEVDRLNDPDLSHVPD
jgi:hypothetical protein